MAKKTEATVNGAETETQLNNDSTLAEANGYEFDFTAVAATAVKAYITARNRNQATEALAAILPACQLEQSYSEPGEVPYKLAHDVIKAFGRASWTYEVDPANVMINLDEITTAEYDNWMRYCMTANVAKQAELISKYCKPEVSADSLLELSYSEFLSYVSRFNQALLDLSKN